MELLGHDDDAYSHWSPGVEDVLDLYGHQRIIRAHRLLLVPGDKQDLVSSPCSSTQIGSFLMVLGSRTLTDYSLRTAISRQMYLRSPQMWRSCPLRMRRLRTPPPSISRRRIEWLGVLHLNCEGLYPRSRNRGARSSGRIEGMASRCEL